jgi:ferrous iron transport protein B
VSHCPQPETGAVTAPETDSLVVLVGNPNVGKSAIFGALTRRYVTVSNYPGTTVEIARGVLPDDTPLIDTPGANSLSAGSEDERVTAQFLFSQRDSIGAIVQVADAKNLRRALLLTVQLSELGVPMVLVLNMSDEAEAHGVNIDAGRLSERLGIEVVRTVAVRGEGVDDVRAAIDRARKPTFAMQYDPGLESAILRTTALLPEGETQARARAVRLLGGDTGMAAHYSLNGGLTAVLESTGVLYGRPLRSEILGQQMFAAQGLMHDAVIVQPQSSRKFARRLGRWMVDPVWGWPFLLLIMWLVFKFVGELGASTLVGFFEGTVFGEWINPAATSIVNTLIPIPFVQDLLVGEYGLITMALTYGVAIVLPIVFTFFLAFSVLEDTGYLPRLAIMFNRLFTAIGLNGKAVLPMVLGLGCDTMATMSTRILDSRRERLQVTLLLALGVPCSAQLGVVLGMLAIVGSGGAAIWLGVVAGTMLAVGWLAARLLPGERGDFIVEVPPLRLPQVGNVVIKTLARMEWYVKEVIPLFVVGTLLLFVLDRTGMLGVIETAGAPVVTGLLGLPPAATAALLIGFLRRDYGAAGLFALAMAGELTPQQMIVSLVVVTLFVPCIANVLMIVKEFGGRTAAAVTVTVFALAFTVGGIVNAALTALR